MLKCQLACFLGVSLLAILPASAAADGVPSLTPGGNDTTYDFTMPGSSRSMDPALSGGAFTWRGTLLLQEDQDQSHFNGAMNVDTNGDGTPDRNFNCSGIAGNGRFGMRCSDSDGLGLVRLTVNGKAVVLPNGKLSLRRTGGRGYTDTYTFLFTFNAVQQ